MGKELLLEGTERKKNNIYLRQCDKLPLKKKRQFNYHSYVIY